jgi:hypothetical protein
MGGSESLSEAEQQMAPPFLLVAATKVKLPKFELTNTVDPQEVSIMALGITVTLMIT